ncbi:MAG: sugar ABC transporter substrate-binding protein [Clostridiales bacterium]|nr:sugar ABC transporter substrate-binding protein [Clostridiales bacterium]
MKKLTAILVALVLTLSMAAALAAEYKPDEYPVAICMSNTNHPVHRIVQLGFLKAAESFGYERGKNVNVIGTEGGDNAEVYAAAEAFAAEGGKGILLWAGDSSAFETIASLGAQNVVVGVPHFKLLKDDGNPPEGLTFNMACDPVLYGKQVAELMAEKLNGKEGSVALTQNTKNVTENSASESFVATWNELAAAGTYDLSKIKVLPVELEGGFADQATAINLGIIQANPDLIGAFGTTGNSPITWADAATKAGKADGELVLVGMDATVGNLEYLKQGKVAAIVAQPLYQEAYKTMEYLNEIFKGNEVPFWTDLVAPIVTLDGTGESGVDFHQNIAAEVAEFFK